MSLADTLLSLVLKPSEARMLVGDLLEERPERGRVWFWAQVFQAMARGLAKSLSAEPRTLVWIGIDSIAAFFFFSFLSWICLGLLAAVGQRFALLGSPFYAVSLVLLVLAPTGATGAWAARRAIRHELAAGILSGAACLLVLSLLGLGAKGYVEYFVPLPGSPTLPPWTMAVALLIQAVTFAGAAVCVRAVRLSRGRLALR